MVKGVGHLDHVWSYGVREVVSSIPDRGNIVGWVFHPDRWLGYGSYGRPMYQVLHDTNNVTDSSCHCVSADHSSRAVGSVASNSELFTVVRLSTWDKSSDIKIGQWGRPWLVWYVPCKRRCVPRFTKKNSNTDIVIAMIVADAVKLTQSELSDSQQVNRTTLFSLTQTNYHSNHR